MKSVKACTSRGDADEETRSHRLLLFVVHQITLDCGLIARSGGRRNSEGQDRFDYPSSRRAPVQQPGQVIRRGRRQRSQSVHIEDAAEQFGGGRFRKIRPPAGFREVGKIGSQFLGGVVGSRGEHGAAAG